MFEIPAALLSWFYGLTASYTIAIGLMAVVVIAVTTPLTLKSTKGMLEMQRLEPELRQLQDEHRNDRVRLNEEMRKLYQEHKINPAVGFLPLLAQAAVFVVMFRVLRGLTYAPRGSARPIADAVWAAFGRPDQVADPGFIPRFLPVDSPLYESLFAEHKMMSMGIDLARSAAQELLDGVVARRRQIRCSWSGSAGCTSSCSARLLSVPRSVPRCHRANTSCFAIYRSSSQCFSCSSSQRWSCTTSLRPFCESLNRSTSRARSFRGFDPDLRVALSACHDQPLITAHFATHNRLHSSWRT